MAKHSGSLELTWTDKDKALLSAGDGRYDYTFVDRSDYRVSEVRLLHEVERFAAPTLADRPAGLPDPTTDNLLITGDAMHVLDSLAKIPEYAEKYLGKVKLVYIDPPFNTGQTFDQYEDNIEHSIWLTMLRDRLRQIKPLLTDDSSVWVHLDDSEVHRCRTVLDEELGPDRFVATIIWEKDKGRRNDTDISSAHDYIHVYAMAGKGWKRVRNLLPRSAAQVARYQNPDSDPRGPWLQGADGTAKSGDEQSRFPVTLPSGRVVTPGKNYWRFSPETLARAISEGRVWFGRSGDSMPIIKRYVSDVQDGLVPRTLWQAEEVGSSMGAKRDHINKMFPDHPDGFATPKPEPLMARIIEISTRPGDLVLDCFAGSGTTAAVAHKLGRRWITSELISDTVETFTKPRLTKVTEDDDPRGITTITTRVEAAGVELPDGMTAVDAQEFGKSLGRVAASVTIEVDVAADLSKSARKSLRDGDSALTADETRALTALLAKVGSLGILDVSKRCKATLVNATRTRDEVVKLWHGGGGFTHLRVGPSMFEEVDGMVLLADWAVHGDLTKAICAQLGVRYRPEDIFAGRKGRVRYVVIDGMVGVPTIEAILERLPEGETVEVWATQSNDAASESLRAARPGSRLRSIPAGVLDAYRRKAAKRTPFRSATATPTTETASGTETSA